MKWHRVRASDKTAWREDLQEDSTLTDLQKRMISIIAKHWDNATMQAECSGSFIALGAGTTEKMVKKYKQSLIASGRVTVKRAATYTTSTLWDVNWWFRGSAYVRHLNGGEPIPDCRQVVPTNAQGVAPNTARGVVPTDAGGGSPGLPGGGPQAETQLLPKGSDRRPNGAAPLAGPQGAPPSNEKKSNPRKMPGFAKWRIVHAGFVDAKGEPDEEGEIFVAHLRSGTNSKFVLRCNIDDDDYWSIDQALGIDGEPNSVIGTMVMMSTNRSGAKEFRRAGPLPWRDALILAGDTADDGGATVRVRFDGDHEANMRLSEAQAASLAEACGGEDAAVGARVRYRLMPDDSLEFRLVEHAPEEEVA
jgi:hypothetical protein